MSEVRVPGYAQGSDLGGEPINWVVYDTETKERRIEWNLGYVPPAPPTELELAQWAVDEAEQELAEAKAHLATLPRHDGEKSSRCSSLHHHYCLLLWTGWCACGYDDCPRSQAEYDAAHPRPKDADQC